MTFPRLGLSLKSRIALTVVGVVAALGWATRAFSEYRFVEDLEQELEGRALTLAAYLAAEAVEPILYQDRLALERLLSHTRSTWSDFVYAYIVDNKGNVLAHSFRGDFPQELHRINRYRGGGAPQLIRARALERDYREIAHPVHGGELGVVHIGFNDASIIELVEQLRRDLVAVLALLAAAGAGIAYGVVYLGLRPLDSIASALERLRPGRHREEIEPITRDELGAVAQRVNVVTAHLHRAQIELEEANRLAVVGRLASVVSHEINNPLASVVTRLSLMERTDDVGFLRDSVGVLRGQLVRLQEIARGLSHASRASRRRLEPCQMEELVRAVMDTLAFDPAVEGIDIAMGDVTAEPALCDRDQVVQVLTNLILNAVQAAQPHGSVAIEARCAQQRIHVDVSDDGAGVSADRASRIFAPFYTTKREGTGLGLAISRNIARQLGGDLVLVETAAAAGPSGATFRLSLPRAELAAAALDSP